MHLRSVTGCLVRWRHRLTTGRPSPLVAAAIIALALAGCAAPVVREPPPAVDAADLGARAERAASRGDHEEAARLWLDLAHEAEGEPRARALLQGATALMEAGEPDTAAQILNRLDVRSLRDPDDRLRARLLMARLALDRHRPGEALAALEADPPPTTGEELRAETHDLRARALLRLGQGLDSARERASREPLLHDPEETRANELLLWQALGTLSDAELRPGADEAADPLAGWRELALIARAAQSGSADIGGFVSDWQARYPAHPAGRGELLDLVLSLQRQQSARPQQIAVLLPQSGPAAAWGQAVRDGFLAAHYARENRSYRPRLRFYDTAGEAAQAVEAYRQAVREGAEFIVGPLTRQAASQVAAEAGATPTLLLNYAETAQASTTSRPLFHFGLSPEDEARQLATRAWLDGHQRTLALIPEGEWGERVLAAFREAWEALGGSILDVVTYAAEDSDFSTEIRTLLKLDESANRRAELESLLQRRLAFEPYRRRDADAIVMAAFPRPARLIRPQLRFHYAGDLPVYSTSHVYAGRPSAAADRDIDGVIFCDIPWILDSDAPGRRAFDAVFTGASGQDARLHALGADSYDLIPMLPTLRLYHYERFKGRTGALHLDEDNRIFRELQWARFQGGVPRAQD